MDWTTIIVAVVAALPGLWAIRHQRKSAEVDAAGGITNSALKLVEANEHRVQLIEREFEDYRKKSELRISHLEREVKLQEIQIDNNNAFTLKLQMALTILHLQLRERGIEPIIDIKNIATTELNELRLIADRYAKLVQQPGAPKDTLIIKGGK